MRVGWQILTGMMGALWPESVAGYREWETMPESGSEKGEDVVE
jgi:hypothetical protein